MAFNWHRTKDALDLFFAGATALFAGLVWWIARKSMEPVCELIVQKGTTDNFDVLIRVHNKSSRTIVVDSAAPYRPRGLRIRHDHFTSDAAKGVIVRNAPTFHDSEPLALVVDPGESDEVEFALSLPVARRSVSHVSMALLIESRSRVMRHRKKVITARLPDRIKKQED